MVNLAHRKRLAQDLRHLVAGTMTNYEFDDAYSDCYADSEDETVRELGGAGYSLYSDNRRYSLRGRDAVSRETRRAMARSVLFLRTDRRYEWPPMPPSAELQTLATTAYLGICAGTAVVLICAMLLASRTRDVEFMILPGCAATAWLAWSVWFRTRKYPREDSAQRRQWQASGNYDVWPFFRREDFHAARRTCHLLGATKESNDRDS